MNNTHRPTLPPWLLALADDRAVAPSVADAVRYGLPPLCAVSLFSADVPGELYGTIRLAPGLAATVLPQVPDFLACDSELAMVMTEPERRAAMMAHAGLLLCHVETMPTAAGRAALVDSIRTCHELGALATVLPAARKIIGPSALAELPAIPDDARLLRLLTQAHIVHDGRHAWSHIHGMAHYGLPDLECRTLVADCEIAVRLLEAGMAGLLADGRGYLPVGGVVEAIEADGRSLMRFAVRSARRVDGHDYDAWGALELVPEATHEVPCATEETGMTAGCELDRIIGPGRRVQDLDLHGMDLHGKDLAGLSGDRLDFSGADLRSAQLQRVRLGGCRLHAASMGGSDWSGATLRICTLDRASGPGARFDDATLEDSSAKGVDLQGASLRAARLSETSFERAVLRDAVLDGASGDGVVFRGADLTGASLRGVRFEDADFRGADLRGANLAGGVLRHADFRGALLEGANFEGTDCGAAEFDREEAAPPVAAGVAGTSTFGALETLMEDIAKQLETGGAPQSALLSDLLRHAGVSPTGEVAPEQAAMLRRILDTLRELQGPVADPEELVERCRSLLQEALPQLGEILNESDWQALYGLLTRLQEMDKPPA